MEGGGVRPLPGGAGVPCVFAAGVGCSASGAGAGAGSTLGRLGLVGESLSSAVRRLGLEAASSRDKGVPVLAGGGSGAGRGRVAGSPLLPPLHPVLETQTATQSAAQKAERLGMPRQSTTFALESSAWHGSQVRSAQPCSSPAPMFRVLRCLRAKRPSHCWSGG